MAIALSYEPTLSRVQIALSALAVTTVRIERSTNELYWETVRGGDVLPVTAGAASLDDYEFPVALTFYRVLDADNLAGGAIESDSITPTFGDCEIWLKSVRYSMLNQQVTIADYSELEQPGRAGVFDVSGRSFPIATTDLASAFRFQMIFTTETAAQGRKLGLSLAVDSTFFLHIPPDTNPRFPPKSMYVVPTSTSIARLGVGEMRHTTVQFTEVAAPSPNVVPTTLVWGTVFRLYGSWGQLISANPTWGDLLATVGSPEDLVNL